jgi:hypothetical protein
VPCTAGDYSSVGVGCRHIEGQAKSDNKGHTLKAASTLRLRNDRREGKSKHRIRMSCGKGEQ